MYLFKIKKSTVGNYRPRTLWDFFMRFYESDRERINMMGYIREHSDCRDYNKVPSKKIQKRYLIDMSKGTSLSWYLLEKYFDGKIIIKEE